MIWKKRQGKSSFMPDGRPKEWKKHFFNEIAQTIQTRLVISRGLVYRSYIGSICPLFFIL